MGLIDHLADPLGGGEVVVAQMEGDEPPPGHLLDELGGLGLLDDGPVGDAADRLVVLGKRRMVAGGGPAAQRYAALADGIDLAVKLQRRRQSISWALGVADRGHIDVDPCAFPVERAQLGTDHHHRDVAARQVVRRQDQARFWDIVASAGTAGRVAGAAGRSTSPMR
jgi:hypothetical protein